MVKYFGIYVGSSNSFLMNDFIYVGNMINRYIVECQPPILVPSSMNALLASLHLFIAATFFLTSITF